MRPERTQSIVMSCTVALVFMLIGCSRQPAATLTARATNAESPDLPGLHNVQRLSDKLISGSSPDGVVGFQSVRQLGVRTIISVDGAKPDVETAKRAGLRYVHLPIGYDGVSEEQGLRLARAVRDLPGPVYLHCHHGKHRGPAAAAVVQRCLDDRCTVEVAIGWLQKAGTDQRYTGLYGAPARFHRLSDAELEGVPVDFPEVAKVPALAEAMVSVEERWDRLKNVRANNWRAPTDQPDIVPAHEGLQLAEAYHEASRLPDVANRSKELRAWLSDAEARAKALETQLRATPVDREAAEQAFRKLETGCTQCHVKYRDVPQGR